MRIRGLYKKYVSMIILLIAVRLSPANGDYSPSGKKAKNNGILYTVDYNFSLMTNLSVNLNKIALLRNARGKNFPDLIDFGRRALDLGAAGLTVHPRPDQRHARYDDLHPLSELIASFPGRELNIEGYPSDDFMQQVARIKPDQCTLVPDTPDQVTSDHGWDTGKSETRRFLDPIIEQLKSQGIRVSLFLDPDPNLVPDAAQTGADRIELYTESFAQAFGTASEDKVLQVYRRTAEAARDLGLGINAGHDLNLDNLGLLIRTIPGIDEVSIGQALTVEALEIGWQSTIQRYLDILARSTMDA